MKRLHTAFARAIPPGAACTVLAMIAIAPWWLSTSRPEPARAKPALADRADQASASASRMQKMGGMSMPGMSMGQESPVTTALRSGDATRGQALFDVHGCAACHGAGGATAIEGPKLAGIAASTTPETMYSYIKNPRAPMPDFHLSDADIADLVAYVDALTPGHTLAADLGAEHPGSSTDAMKMGGMNMDGSGTSGESMAVAPTVYPLDQAAQTEAAQGPFLGIETGDASSGA